MYFKKCRPLTVYLLTENQFFLGGRLVRFTVSEAGTGGEAVSLPVTSILAVVTTTFGAGVNPDGLSCRNHFTA